MCRPSQVETVSFPANEQAPSDTLKLPAEHTTTSLRFAWLQDIPHHRCQSPISPVSSFDNRPAINDLLEEHRLKIDAIAQGLQEDPLYEPTIKHDDLWILRFWLSHKNVKKAIKAAKKTLIYRKEWGLDEIDMRYLKADDDSLDYNPMRTFLEYCRPGGFFTYACLEKDRAPIAIVDAGCIEANRMVKELPKEYWNDLFQVFSEFSFQWCDYVTRTTGRLTKTVRFFDLSNMRLAEANLENVRRCGKALHDHEDYYPQLLDAVYVSHAPVWIQYPWKLARPLLPARLVSKMDFVQPSKSRADRQRIYAHISQEALPTLLGGDSIIPIQDLQYTPLMTQPQ